ncbi:unnamed protein product [Rotaria socialis]|uniref:EF-hand domain-containing protein n=1 Tax=Rotaria socialis TaxID=392032 RepID=A0A820XIQ8_9BILA|nr:unnamed protein product [Rotaria socialis]CAF3332732.1 unnamed protein product [Rotaria socialis]CAF3333649.1 unnamed protein product [Rotaria socialis]CAF3395099.1 unnamed protein product [Rotaria socialis]CAF4237394.1 unnamed protein product [Rotaria socialis]
MGGSSSRKAKNTPIPTYSVGLNRPVGQLNTGIGNASPANRDPQRDLMQANQTIANLTNQIQAMQRGGGSPVPFGGYSPPYGIQPPAPYGGYSPPYGGYPPQYGGPPSPLLQNFGRHSPYQHQQQTGAGGYRDTDFASVASISGLNASDVALLHREFMNLTRGGTTKMDRSIFRSLLRDVLMERSNDYVDRAIENIFLTVDRNHDGHIDFAEFVGAFKDVLKGGNIDADGIYGDSLIPDMFTQEIRASGFGAGALPRAIAGEQQSQAGVAQFFPSNGLSMVPLASTGIQQMPLNYGGAVPLQISNAQAPLITLDQSQSSFVIATPGQYLITQPTALQCVPLPMSC